ncbi:hypothetical protein ELQ87_25470 [Streptomyces griseoviridis]|uniref:Uncharacterized protein n=1 Tax=Streptomyces griseoviridis TaxID=45398 RepID=A0A3S9ZHF1_STRGD|nr:hypothetical protein [Streptomyces griseoviridis]AZS87214.1 hypothetical protein ELQ87_25470 [Streptomyces griseoviridis]QCN85932.1 hypothetical protein DDJ31_13805 [Streptomyces griseoviridis]
MSLQATEFFTELCLPFHHHAVVGNTYYAAPAPGTPLRLRIDFTPTIRADTYGGLRVAVVHPDRGETDAVALSFVDHGTFHRRDEANHTRPNTNQYGTFDTYHRPGRPPWDGAVTSGLRDAIEQYTAVWFPGAWAASMSKKAAGRIPRSTPAPSVAPAGPPRTH